MKYFLSLIVMFMGLFYIHTAEAAWIICNGFGPNGIGFDTYLIKDAEAVRAPNSDFPSVSSNGYTFVVKNIGSKHIGTELKSIEAVISIRNDRTNLPLAETTTILSEESDYITLKSDGAWIVCQLHIK